MKRPVGWMAMKFLLKLRTTRGQYCSITVRVGGGYFLKWPIRGSSAQKRYLFQASGIWKGKRIKGLFVVESELSSVSSYFTGTPLIQIIQMQHNRIKNPTGRRQPVGYLQAWPRIWTRYDREQIQLVARAGLEPRAAGLRVRRADHSATLSPSASFPVGISRVELYQRVEKFVISFRKKT